VNGAKAIRPAVPGGDPGRSRASRQLVELALEEPVRVDAHGREVAADLQADDARVGGPTREATLDVGL
jgi:hypothetical protein